MSHSILAFENPKSRVEMELQGTSLCVRACGPLDGDLDLTSVIWATSRLKKVTSILFDMKSMSSVTKEGAISWHAALSKISTWTLPSYVNLKESLIEYANNIAGLLGQPYLVQSFEAPFHCVTCQKEYSVILESRRIQVTNNNATLPTLKCQKCDNILDFAWLEGDYFKFLKQQSKQSD